MFSRHALSLAISDGILVLSTGLSVPFAIALKKGWLNYYGMGLVIQHTMQTVILFSAITWTFNRQVSVHLVLNPVFTFRRKWPWVQSGFLTLHSLVMIMKMHSYMATNGYLQSVDRQRKRTLDALRSAASRVGGWDTARTEAKAHQLQAQNKQQENGFSDPTPDSGGSVRSTLSAASTASTEEVTPSMTPSTLPDGTTRSYIDADMAVTLRKRLLHESASKEGTGASSARSAADDDALRPIIDTEYNILAYHPDEDISNLANELIEMDQELNSSGKEKVRWPNNISLANFADYQLIPTLVYELEYPRTDR